MLFSSLRCPLYTHRARRVRSLSRDQPSLPCFLLRSLPSALLTRFISFFRPFPSASRAHTRTHRPVSFSPSVSLSFPTFSVPTTKNVANVRIDRSLSRALPPFFTLLPSANPLLLFLLHLLLLPSPANRLLRFNLLRHPLYSSLRSPLPYSPSALHARTYFFCR